MSTRILSFLSTIAVGLLSTSAAFGQVAPDNVSAPGIDGYQLLYAFEEIPEAPNFTLGADWDVDNSDTPVEGIVDRIGFYYQLDDDWVWASLPAYTQDLKQMGFPGNGSDDATAPDFLVQELLPDLTVETNSDFVTPGTFDQAGVEIWRFNYSQRNSNNVPGASDETFDFGDTPGSDGDHGSFQIHNVTEGETIFGISHFNRGLNFETTIGNVEGDNTDGTFNQIGDSFFDRILEIYVKPFDGLDGDFNLDGVIDNADLTIIAANLNEVGTTRETGDLNGDFETDLTDFILFREAFNAPAGAAAAASQSVPEPSGFGLACLAMLGVLSARRRQSR